MSEEIISEEHGAGPGRDEAPAADRGHEHAAMVPDEGERIMPMVGIGGSAGSIQPILSFFQAMPADSGMAFVVILHLSPEHESTLPELIQRVTSMPAVAVLDTVKVKANRVYVIPPGKALSSADGELRVDDLHSERGRRVAVDLFFRTLADSHGSRSAAIVLSGADSDGALGIKRIKERGGLTIAQEPDEAEHSSMPRASIQTGMIDWVLRVAQMPGRLLEYYRIGERLKLPPEEGPQPEVPAPSPPAEAEAALREVLSFLRTRTGRDFSYYKRATILRRISRRMQVNGIDELQGYLAFLRTHPGEAGALLQDLLISVTNFFRDRESFDALAQHIPEIFRGKGPNDCVRAWVPACASGEEAYSIAMLLAEHARTLEAPPEIQVFATDLDEDAIAVARTGAYPFTIPADVSEERLRRYFTMDHRGYRVRPELRETLLFACHDLLRDSPFSRMNLISCRNLLIYLNRDAQARAFETFAFALWPEGQLFLGSSETVDDGSPLFRVLDKKHRIYLHRSTSRPILSIPIGAGTLARTLQAQDQSRERASRSGAAPPEGLAVPGPAQGGDGDGGPPVTWSELHFKLIERLAPPSVVVNGEYDIVHLSKSAGRYLQFGAGELKRNLLELVNPMLRVQLRAALFQAAQSHAPAEILGVPAEIEGVREAVNLRVRPAGDLAPDFLLVILEPGAAAPPASPESEAVLAERLEEDFVKQRLEREMDSMKSRLRETVEQYEASTEELKASNEELQAMNEELRSATEELETSREELQSINEELSTVNQELKSKLDELSHANSDLHNLMVSTAIPTIFLDRDLHIMRYTPSAVKIFNLIPTDVGRPLTDLKHRLRYPELENDTRNVLLHLSSIEHEVRDERDGRWFLTRLLPYRTMDEQVAGVVLTLVNITESKRAAADLEKSESRFRALVTQAKAGIVETDLERRFTFVNDRFCEIAGREREDLIGKEIEGVMPREDLSRDLPLFERMIETGTPFELESRFIRPDGSVLWTVGTFTRLDDPEGNRRGILAVVVDLTEHRRAMEDLEKSRAELWEALMENERVRRELEAASNAKDQFLAVLSHELRTPLTPVLMAARMLGRRSDLPPDMRESIEMIRRNVQIEAQFVDDLLDVTRIERGKLEIVREPVNLHTVIQQAIAVAEGEFQEKRQPLDVELRAGNCEVTGDATRLQQVMWNILKNASKFSPEEGRIRVETWNKEGRVLASVSDHGIGIDPGALAVIFDPFHQENLEVTRQYGGLGLGLAIARATVDAHGGTLRAQSAGRGAGATFIVELPVRAGGE